MFELPDWEALKDVKVNVSHHHEQSPLRDHSLHYVIRFQYVRTPHYVKISSPMFYLYQ